MVDVYYLNGVFLLIPLLDWLKVFRSSIRDRPVSVIKEGTLFGLALMIALTPNFIIKWIIHGSPWISGYEDRFFWASPKLLELAFSPEHGFFLWTPVLLFAVIGLVWLWRRDRYIGATLMLTFAVFFYVVASYQNWHGLSSFGNRFFVSFTPIFVLGLALFLEKSQAFLSRVTMQQGPSNSLISIFSVRPSIVYFGLVLLSLWNIGLAYQWGANLIPNRGPVDFAVVARNQTMLVPQRAVGFILRYLTSREQVMQEVERQDLMELKDFGLQR